ncbi:efflux RND transporter periplasmic adaptor subunit [Rubritalea spongiae]|uniref:Efflux RND transporter periplasmic adaptor subunit n=1 Tax=Rubritalea spongiae TaxID=430797 RepID=A0ABW5E5L9_9BACT
MKKRHISRMAQSVPNKAFIPILTVLTISFASISAAQDNAKPVVVTQATKLDQLTNKITLTGTVTSPRRARLSSRIEGLINKMNVDAGHSVKKGDVLMELDPKLSELSLDLIAAEQEQAAVELANAQRLVDETKPLIKTGAFPESQANTLQSDVHISEAKIKQLEAREKVQQERIARHKLVAPFDGVVVNKLAETGEWVTTGTPVVELIEMENLRFDIQVPQEFLSRLRNAQKATVKLDAFPNQTFDAKLAVVVPVKNAVSRTFLIRLAIDGSDNNAAPGMSGTATIESLHSDSPTVQIPRDAVVRFPDGTAKVWIVQTNGSESSVVSREVQTAGRLGEMAEIVEGLKGGETLVLKGNEGLRENQKVSILKAQETNSH